jgi:hypothetical protein
MSRSTTEKLGSPSENSSELDNAVSDIAAKFDEGTEIDDAIAEAIHDALVRHKRAGNPVAAWVEGKVVWIQPEDIPT